MKTLNLNDSACCSIHKVEGLCNSCLRNIDLFDSTKYIDWKDYNPYQTSRFKLKNRSNFKCEGFKK